MSLRDGLSHLVHRSRGALNSFLGMGVGHDETAAAAAAAGMDGLGKWSSGFGFGHGFLDGELLGWSVQPAYRTALFWIAILMVFMIIAMALTPDEASFRSHLTELSFRRHLAGIHSSRSNDESRTDEGEKEGHDASPAPFRFANRVAISLRTPPLVFQAMFLYSIALTAPLAPPAFLDNPPKGKNVPTGGMSRETVIWIGFLGHWHYLGECRGVSGWYLRRMADRGHGSLEKGKKRGSVADRPGVLEMKVVASKEEPIGKLPPTTPSVKLLRKSDSIASLNDTATLPLHVTPTKPESRRPSLGVPSLLPTAVPSPPPPIPPSEADSPLIISLKSDLFSAQTVLADLKAQLASHDISASDSQANVTLEDLRVKRKEDDAERAELKSRTRSLEEQKRQAEAARKEAEKKLKSVEGVRDGVQGKIAAAIAEMGSLRDKMSASKAVVQDVQGAGEKFIVSARQAAEEKRKDVEAAEEEVQLLEEKNEELGVRVKEAEDKLKQVQESAEKNAQAGLNPEEEMMMMAAAYEAAAQEGYHHPPHNPVHAQQSQWATQAAQYMAEAGFPHLDPSYTARPAHGFSHHAPAAKTEASKADVSGFEDFGPTLKPAPSTPPREFPAADETEVYGDPGSPNGGISSAFSANLLPQGLFRSLSLEGDSTSLDDQSVTLSPGHVKGHDSGSDSDGEDLWRSPMAEPDAQKLSGPNLSHPAPPVRMLSSSTTPPVLSGLPTLPGSRWFGTSSSTENLAFNPFHPTTSNDSLNLPYETSPFAPSASEKKALALKWGPLSKYRWAGSTPRSASASADLLAGSGGEGNGWLNFRHGASDKAVGGSGGPYGLLGNGHGQGHANGLPLPGVGESEGEMGTGDEKEKKAFRFFSLRKPPQSSSTLSSSPGSGGQPL